MMTSLCVCAGERKPSVVCIGVKISLLHYALLLSSADHCIYTSQCQALKTVQASMLDVTFSLDKPKLNILEDVHAQCCCRLRDPLYYFVCFACCCSTWCRAYRLIDNRQDHVKIR
jgi:hypothetical protein